MNSDPFPQAIKFPSVELELWESQSRTRITLHPWMWEEYTSVPACDKQTLENVTSPFTMPKAEPFQALCFDWYNFCGTGKVMSREWGNSVKALLPLAAENPLVLWLRIWGGGGGDNTLDRLCPTPLVHGSNQSQPANLTQSQTTFHFLHIRSQALKLESANLRESLLWRINGSPCLEK